MKRLITKVTTLLLILLPLTCGTSMASDIRGVSYILPTRVLWSANSDNIDNIEALLINNSGQADLNGANLCRIRNSKDSICSFLLDFGREIEGGVEIVTGMSRPSTPIKIRVRFGESVSEAMCEIDGQNGATNDHALRDFTMELPWLGTIQSSNSGFRFVRIDILDDAEELQLKEVRAISRYRDIPYLGSFTCDNPRLNEIWRVGAHTVHINMQEYLWDGVKRDRLVWIGDMHPEVMTINSVFGYNEVVPKSLDFIRDITPLPRWMNDISSYSIWWLLIQRDWYYYQGDINYLFEQRGYVEGLLEQLLECVDEDGKECLSGGRFLDWPSSPNQCAINAGLQSLLVKALAVGQELALIFKNGELAERCAKKRQLMVEYAPKLVAELRSSGRLPYEAGSKQGAALLSLAGLMDAKEANREYLSANGAHGFSTFYGYYMVEAMAKAGDYQGAMDIISDYWGAMIDLGATTFWEDFNIEWIENAAPIDELLPEGRVDIHRTYGDYCYKGYRHSLAHGWASGPTAWLSRHVLGVEVVEPGCKVVRVKANLGDLNYVKGTFPTPYGVIYIEHKKMSSGEIHSKIDAPKGVKIIKK